MVNTISPPAIVTYGAIHFAKVFPVARTTCSQARVPAAASWAVVTCPQCLEVGSTKCQAARDRITHLAKETAALRQEGVRE